MTQENGELIDKIREEKEKLEIEEGESG